MPGGSLLNWVLELLQRFPEARNLGVLLEAERLKTAELYLKTAELSSKLTVAEASLAECCQQIKVMEGRIAQLQSGPGRGAQSEYHPHGPGAWPDE